MGESERERREREREEREGERGRVRRKVRKRERERVRKRESKWGAESVGGGGRPFTGNHDDIDKFDRVDDPDTRLGGITEPICRQNNFSPVPFACASSYKLRQCPCVCERVSVYV